MVITWLGFILAYPTIRWWSLSDAALQNLSQEDRAFLMQRATIPGLDLKGGYRLQLEVDVSKLTERGGEGALIQVADIIRERLKGIGVIESVVRQTGPETIEVMAPVSADTTQLKKLLSHPGRLTFSLFKDGAVVQDIRRRIDAALAARAAADSMAAPSSATPFSDLLASLNIVDDIADIVVEESRIPAVRALLSDTTVTRVLQSFNRANPPAGGFVLSTDPVERSGSTFYPLYFINRDPDLIGNPIASTQVSEASQVTEEYAPYAVRILLNDEGREDLTNLSSANTGKRLAVGLGEDIVMTLTIQGRISDGRTEIPGGKTIFEGRILATALETGILPVSVTVTESIPIPPLIIGGTATADAAAQAGVIALFLAGALLIILYRACGAVASLGILFQLLITVTILRLWNTTGITPLLTLSGAAGLALGIILMLGGHILFFERLREELAAEAAPKNAIVSAITYVRPLLVWIHAVILILTVVFIALGSGPVLDGALLCFSSVAASLITFTLMTETILFTLTTAWNVNRLSV